MNIILQMLLLVVLVPAMCANPTGAEPVRGLYGIPSAATLHPSTYIDDLKRDGVTAVFVPADEETVRWFKAEGFTVYLSVNVFGGKGAWEKYPDAQPVKADGSLLGSEPGYRGSGGVCPTHQAWRQERINAIRKLVHEFGGEDGIDGIWLDFIRYPGRWEDNEPVIPDTCYCARCLSKFRHDTNSKLPPELAAKEAAAWIAQQCPYEWMVWKKEQINAFVAEARSVVGARTLGVFLVPWTKGERNNAISYQLAQDPFALAQLADVISPMVYHKMCHQPPSWVGAMTSYYKETARCPVWPIVQSIDCQPEEFRSALQSAGNGDADGLLVFSFNGMGKNLWDCFDAFQPPVNLIENSALLVPEGKDKPRSWGTGNPGEAEVVNSVFSVASSESLSASEHSATNCIGIAAGNDRAGAWYCALGHGEAGVEYLFTGNFYREHWKNGVYPSLSFWGEERSLDTHWLSKTFQPLRVYVTCPEQPADALFKFINDNPGETFWLTKPRLRRNECLPEDPHEAVHRPSFYKGLFPIGVYGAARENLQEIKDLGINTAVIGGDSKTVQNTIHRCHQLGLRYMLNVPRDPDKLRAYLDHISGLVKPQLLSFYVNDEPGIHSFPLNKSADIHRLIKERFPEAATCMAVVRPQVCRDYLKAADFFMLDQYPVPSMPMTWLSDSMDKAAEAAGCDRLASVIQAFGGKRYEDQGWPRMPTWQEMDCLAFLSIVHGSRGVFFFTFAEIGKTKQGREQLGRVVHRLKSLHPWLVKKNLEEQVTVTMLSSHRFDPNGRPALHCALKQRGGQLLLLAVNAIGTHTEALLQLPSSQRTANLRDLPKEWREVFSQAVYPVIDGNIRARFEPYETKAFVSRVLRVR